MAEERNPKAFPYAQDDLQTSILELIRQTQRQKLVKRGANEVTKAVNRNKAAICVLAADAKPIEILMHLPLICEDKNVPYVFLKSKSALGSACNVSREVIAATILKPDKRNSKFEKEIFNVQDEIERISAVSE
mmetsp:Transcript_3080/g.4529  ORF Transcript_3080/g.4529 Transcript_3080/m.4529 type:complete len:133 (+) Transcript_3080:78-476(+)